MTQVIYGSDLSAKMREQMKQEIADIAAKGERIPCLAVVMAGDNPASLSYIKGKEKACQAIGMRSLMKKLPEDITQQRLEDVLKEL